MRRASPLPRPAGVAPGTRPWAALPDGASAGVSLAAFFILQPEEGSSEPGDRRSTGRHRLPRGSARPTVRPTRQPALRLATDHATAVAGQELGDGDTRKLLTTLPLAQWMRRRRRAATTAGQRPQGGIDDESPGSRRATARRCWLATKLQRSNLLTAGSAFRIGIVVLTGYDYLHLNDRLLTSR